MGSIFTQVLKDANQGTVLKPLLHSYLYEAQWPEDFSVTFYKGALSRPPDGMFHPSQHPLWPERMLWFYLTHPDEMIAEPFAYMNTLAVTMGTAVHGFIQTCLAHMGILVLPAKLRMLGFDVNPLDGEPAFQDDEVGCRGHGDGILQGLHLPADPSPYYLFEFKSSNEWAMGKIEDLDLEAFKLKWPLYYAQAQEYLRMTGYHTSIVLFMQMGYPWTLREFHIPFNPRFAYDTRDKYQRVRLAVTAGEMPMPCCGPRSEQAKVCPARQVCPIGQA